ncbi:hypothetical protein ACQ4PT_069538 [Festuca glaucescens]
MSLELAFTASLKFPADMKPPESTPAMPTMPRKRLGTTGVARSTIAAAKTTTKSFKATMKAGKVGRPPGAPVLSGPRARKPTKVMVALSQAKLNKVGAHQAMASQSSVEFQKDSTMDDGDLHENDESPPLDVPIVISSYEYWTSLMINIVLGRFEELDLEVDEENLCSTDKMTKNDAHSIKKDDNSQKLGIGSSDKERPECKHPAACALILPRKDEEKREESMTDPDDYLTGCHTHNTTGTCFGSSTCPWSNRTLPAPHSRPLIGAQYLLSDEEAKEYYSTKRRLTYRRRPKSGMEPMIEECLLAFRNYVKNNSLEDTEHRFGELVCHCATVHVKDKIYQHFNFIIETKLRNSDIWTPKLYFAEVKELSSGKYYFCCPLEASDSGMHS